MNFADKRILITGGSSGIGKALIGELYQRGARRFAVIGRDPDKMQALKPEFPEAELVLLKADLAEPTTARCLVLI